jgi:hypothetical protein
VPLKNIQQAQIQTIDGWERCIFHNYHLFGMNIPNYPAPP